MKIYIVGFMGAGKTVAGRALAERLAFPFLDLDELIESAEAMPLRQIFAEKGEAYFRRREREILRSTQNLDHGVISTGGGTFTFEENIQFVLAHGFSFYLSAPLALLRQRIGAKAADRPMYRDEEAFAQLYQHRLRYYKMSDITIEVRAEESVAEIVERMLMLLPKEFFSRFPRRLG